MKKRLIINYRKKKRKLENENLKPELKAKMKRRIEKA